MNPYGHANSSSSRAGTAASSVTSAHRSAHSRGRGRLAQRRPTQHRHARAVAAAAVPSEAMPGRGIVLAGAGGAAAAATAWAGTLLGRGPQARTAAERRAELERIADGFKQRNFPQVPMEEVVGGLGIWVHRRERGPSPKHRCAPCTPGAVAPPQRPSCRRCNPFLQVPEVTAEQLRAALEDEAAKVGSGLPQDQPWPAAAAAAAAVAPLHAALPG